MVHFFRFMYCTGIAGIMIMYQQDLSTVLQNTKPKVWKYGSSLPGKNKVFENSSRIHLPEIFRKIIFHKRFRLFFPKIFQKLAKSLLKNNFLRNFDKSLLQVPINFRFFLRILIQFLVKVCFQYSSVAKSGREYGATLSYNQPVRWRESKEG